MSDYLKEGFIDEVKGCLGGRGGQENVIESIKVNGVGQTVDENKAVNIPVPTKTSDLDNDSGYQTNSEVSSTVAAEVAKIVADAPEDFDTLKEMSDWISQHEDSAAAMNSSILKNKEDIEALQTSKANVSDVQTVEASVDELNSNLVEQGINLFDKTRITNGKGISNSSGGEYPDENVFSTDYIDVLIYKKIVCNRDYGIDDSLFGAFYDDNKSFVSGFLITKSKTIIIPSGVKYVRITFMNKQLDGLCIWNVNSAIGSVAEEVSAQNESLSVIGKCKNLLNPTLQTTTQNGVTCTNNGDGTYTLNGTANANTQFEIKARGVISKQIKLVGCPMGGSNTSYNIVVVNYNGSDIRDNGNGITIPTNTECAIRIYVESGTTLSNKVFKPMLTTNDSVTYDDFVPYTGDGETLTHDVAELKNDLVNINIVANSNLNADTWAADFFGLPNTSQRTIYNVYSPTTGKFSHLCKRKDGAILSDVEITSGVTYHISGFNS